MASLNQIGSSRVVPGGARAPYVAGMAYPPDIPNYSTQTGRTATADRIYMVPIYIDLPWTFSAIKSEQTSAGTTGNARYGLYRGSWNEGGALIADLGAVSYPASTGLRTATGSMAVTIPGWHTMVFLANAALVSYGINEDAAAYAPRGAMAREFGVLGTSSLDIYGTGVGFRIAYGSQAYGALPGTLPAVAGWDIQAPVLHLIG